MADELLVEAKETLWLPVETTLLKSPFVAAWEEGAKKYRNSLKAEDLEIFFTHDEQKKYPPVSHAPVKRKWWPAPAAHGINQFIDYDLQIIEQWKDQFIEERFWAILKEHPDSLLVRNRLGCFYAGLSKYEEAMLEFKTVLSLDSSYAPSLNNRGNVHFIKGNLREARDDYERSLATDEFKLGTYLNLAILYQLMAQVEEFSTDSEELRNKSYELMQDAARLLEGESIRALALLGIPRKEIETLAEQPDDKKKEKTWKDRIEEVKKFINRTFAVLIEKKHKHLEKQNLKSAGPTGDEEDEDRRFILYWNFEGV